MKVIKSIRIRGKKYDLPMFLPDATKGVVKSLDSHDLKSSGVEGVVVNTYHLRSEPGLKTLSKFGGIKKFMNFHDLVVSDSGGWQIFSLIHRSHNKGKISNDGVMFTAGDSKKSLFTPELSIRTQFDIGSDIIICLDDFTPPQSSEKTIKESVDRTILWANKCKREYENIIKKREIPERMRPLLFSVPQGGSSKKLRKYCVEKLVEIGFDGYGFGGYPFKDDGSFDFEIAEYLAKLLPKDSIKFALGVGTPHNITKCAKYGWQLFDCTLPTRDARHKRLYVFSRDPNKIKRIKRSDIHHLTIKKEKHKNNHNQISKYCDCHTCRNFSLSYLYQLFKIRDTSAYRLATIHNLRTYTRLMKLIRETG